MIINKFPYSKITKNSVNGKRLYSTPDGYSVASVTTILDQTKSEESKKALQNWRKSIGFEKAQEITTEAASRGTRMHSYLEAYVSTDTLPVPGSNPYAKQSNEMAKVILEKGLNNLYECYGSEVSLYYPELFAGTTDLVGLYKGELAILDFKQTNKPKDDSRVEDYKIQLAAYIEAHDKLYDTKINLGVILMCSKDMHFQTWEVAGNELEEYKHLWWNKVAQYYNAE